MACGGRRALTCELYTSTRIHIDALECLRNTFIKNYFPSATKSKLQSLGVFALEVNEILQATPPKLRREKGMCGNAAIIIYLWQYYTNSRTCSSLVQPRSRCSIPGTWYTVHTSITRLQDQRYGGLFRAGKLHVSRDYVPHHRQVLQEEQRRPHVTEKEKRSFPMERGSIANHNPAWKPQCMLKSRKLLCPKPKVTPRFSIGDVREARWLLSHRWTETCPILPDIAHDSRNQRRVVSLSALSLSSPRVSDSASCAKFITTCSKR